MKSLVITVIAGIVLITCSACAQSAPAAEKAEKIEAGYYVSPTGKADAAGTFADPWDIYSALGGEQKKVQLGDTLWVRGGVYASKPNVYASKPNEKGERRDIDIKLAGTEQKPILVRQVKGERAIVDAIVSVSKPTDYIQIWDLEIAPAPGVQPVYETTQSGSWPSNLSPAGGGFDVRAGKGCKYINLYIHDNPGGGSGFWVGATDSEFYGCVIVNNGWKGPDRYHGHAIYTQNNEGTKRVTNCVLNTRNNDGQYTLHAYTEKGFLKNFDIQDNIAYSRGVFLVGGGQVAEHILVKNNYLYQMPMQIKNGADCVIQDNILYKSSMLVRKYKQAVIADNLIVGADTKIEQVEKVEGKNKTEAPTAPMAILLPNKYDTGRANLAIFNFSKAASVDVKVAGFLKSGEEYRLMNPEDLFGKPVFTGKVKGDKISVPMKDEFAAFVVFKGQAAAAMPK